MSPEAILAVIGGVVAGLSLLVIIVRKLPKRVKAHKYTKKWRELQKLCRDKETWPEAIVTADKLLDDVLKRKRKSGKTMGERMVEAGNIFSNNDAIWNAHKLAAKLEKPSSIKLKEAEVKEALVAFRQALRDLGAL